MLILFWLELLINQKRIINTGYSYVIDLSYLGLKGILTHQLAGPIGQLLIGSGMIFPWTATVQALPKVLQAIFLLFFYDLVSYFAHRRFHFSPWWWPLHFAHHSTPYYSVLSANRLHPLMIP